MLLVEHQMCFWYHIPKMVSLLLTGVYCFHCVKHNVPSFRTSLKWQPGRALHHIFETQERNARGTELLLHLLLMISLLVLSWSSNQNFPVKLAVFGSHIARKYEPGTTNAPLWLFSFTLGIFLLGMNRLKRRGFYLNQASTSWSFLMAPDNGRGPRPLVRRWNHKKVNQVNPVKLFFGDIFMIHDGVWIFVFQILYGF